jgi:hypothetical protein
MPAPGDHPGLRGPAALCVFASKSPLNAENPEGRRGYLYAAINLFAVKEVSFNVNNLIPPIPTTPFVLRPKLHSTVNLLTTESMLLPLRSETEMG